MLDRYCIEAETVRRWVSMDHPQSFKDYKTKTLIVFCCRVATNMSGQSLIMLPESQLFSVFDEATSSELFIKINTSKKVRWNVYFFFVVIVVVQIYVLVDSSDLVSWIQSCIFGGPWTLPLKPKKSTQNWVQCLWKKKVQYSWRLQSIDLRRNFSEA